MGTVATGGWLTLTVPSAAVLTSYSVLTRAKYLHQSCEVAQMFFPFS